MTAPTRARALVVAKAPVAGRVKTRLGADIGHAAAADLAAAALLDTIAACVDAFGADDCLIALSGDLADAVRGDEIARALEGWGMARQRGSTFAERLANAHADVPAGGPVVQVGMDTPQVHPALLRGAADLAHAHRGPVLGPAVDGGWWVLVTTHAHQAGVLTGVPMSRPDTGRLTAAALAATGAAPVDAPVLRDVDEVEDAHVVAAEAPATRFAARWREVVRAGLVAPTGRVEEVP